MTDPDLAPVIQLRPDLADVVRAASAALGGLEGPVSTMEEAAQRATEIRQHLSLGFGKLALARERRDDAALGYPSWWQYVEGEFGDLANLGLPAGEREYVVESMRVDALMSQREIADRLATSAATVNGDLKRRGVVTDTVKGKDGKTYTKPQRTAPEKAPEFARLPGMSKRTEVVERIRHAGRKGMTCRELELATGWHHGKCSSPLSAVATQHRVEPTGERRLGYGVYVAPEFLPVEGVVDGEVVEEVIPD
jgi:hypothetical protein